MQYAAIIFPLEQNGSLFNTKHHYYSYLQSEAKYSLLEKLLHLSYGWSQVGSIISLSFWDATGGNILKGALNLYRQVILKNSLDF